MQGKQAMDEKLSVQTENPTTVSKSKIPNVRFLKYSWKRWRRRETSKLRKVGSSNQAVEVREEG